MKNYWKVDESGITPKMRRRHFNYIIDKFSELSHQTHQTDKCEHAVVHQPLLPICNVPANKSEVKFTGPFSIDSILKSDHKVTHSTCLKGRFSFQDARITTKKSVSNTTHFYSCTSLGCEFDTVDRSRLFTESQGGLAQIPFDHRALHVNCSFPQMYASTYAG